MIHRNELSVRIEPTGRYIRFRYDFVAPVPVEQARRALQDYFTNQNSVPEDFSPSCRPRLALTEFLRGDGGCNKKR
jgi:hypothetical protein